MASNEREIINDRLKALSADERRFRINAGMAWTGDVLHVTRPMRVQVNPGDVVIHGARPFHGAPEGWPDLCGWDSVEITEEMIGSRAAIFTGEEVKTGRLRLSDVQRRFRDCLLRMGGRFGVLRENQVKP